MSNKHNRSGKSRRLAIVGAGVTGSSFLSFLIGRLRGSQIKCKMEIHIFEGSGEFGTGLPYKTNLPVTCLLNQPNDYMGWIAPEDPYAGPEDYVQYLQKNADTLAEQYDCLDVSSLKDPKGYTPRFIYGQYLKEGFLKIESLAKLLGIHLIKHAVCVKEIRVMGKTAELTYQENSQLVTTEFENVILTTGHWGSEFLEELSETGRFFPVYPVEPLRNKDVFTGKRVAVIGTGLSGIDAAFTLIKSGVQKVIMTSRQGWLRAIKCPISKYHRRFFTKQVVDDIFEEQGYITLQQVTDLFLQEYNVALNTCRGYQQNPEQYKDDAWSCYVGQNFYVADNHPDAKDFLTPDDAVERLKYHIHETESCPSHKGVLWRSILASFYEKVDGFLAFGDYIYQRMQNEDKSEYMKKIYKVGINFHASMPLSSAKRLLNFYQQDQLEILKGFKSIAFDVDSCSLKMEMNDGESIYVDYVVDATNQSRDLNDHPLYGQLIEDGSAVKHPAGGISIELNTYKLLDKNGYPSSVLRTVGPILHGSTYTIKAFDSLGDVESTKHIAEQIHAELVQDLAVAAV
ncbi:MAG: FAD/NAD(P)-binding protein [Cyanobacteria bacterium P01_A01_bin.83]